MLAPSLVVVDTSAAIELLVADAPSRREYVALFAHLRASDYEIAYSELLEVELLEAAFTWDVRRERRLDWRQARRDGTLQLVGRLCSPWSSRATAAGSSSRGGQSRRLG